MWRKRNVREHWWLRLLLVPQIPRRWLILPSKGRLTTGKRWKNWVVWIPSHYSKHPGARSITVHVVLRCSVCGTERRARKVNKALEAFKSSGRQPVQLQTRRPAHPVVLCVSEAPVLTTYLVVILFPCGTKHLCRAATQLFEQLNIPAGDETFLPAMKHSCRR